MVTPTLEPSSTGLTTKGGGNGKSPGAVSLSTTMPSGQTRPYASKMVLACGLFMASAEAVTTEWV